MPQVWVSTAPIYAAPNVRAFNANEIVPDSVAAILGLEAKGLVQRQTVDFSVESFHGVDPVTQAELDAFISLYQGFTVMAPPPTGGDDHALLTAALAPGITLTLVPGATYKLSEPLVVPPGATLRGNATITRLSPATQPDFLVSMSDGAILRDGVKVAGSTAYGVHISNAVDASVIGCNFSQIDGYAILCEGASARTLIQNNRIRHTTAGKGQGVTVKGGVGGLPTDASIIGNLIDAHGMVGLESQENAARVTFTGNVVRGTNIGISASNVVGATVSGNVTYGCPYYGIEVAGGRDFSVTGNTVDCANIENAQGIALQGNPGPVNGTVTGNSIRGVGNNGIGIRGVWPELTQVGVTVADNSIKTAHHSIVLTFASGFLIVGNACDGSGTGVSAVGLEACVSGLVANNLAHAFTQACINAYSGAMTNITHGPNLLSGGTPAQLINGPLGTGSRDKN